LAKIGGEGGQAKRFFVLLSNLYVFIALNYWRLFKKPNKPFGKVDSNFDHTSYLSPTRIEMEILYAPKKQHKQPNIAIR
jgi:hypothetical protein